MAGVPPDAFGLCQTGRNPSPPPPPPGCTPESAAQTCAGKCGTVTNNCGTPVDCGSCGCASACPVCQTCNTSTDRCQTNPAFLGLVCAAPGQVCQGDGACACDNGSCEDGQRCNGLACICDGTSCAAGCCNGTGTCHIDDDATCGTGGGSCTRCSGHGVTCGGGGVAGTCGCTPQGCGSQSCGSTVDNCGQPITCSGCAGCCDGNTCRPATSQSACGTGGGECTTCAGTGVTCGGSGTSGQCGCTSQGCGSQTCGSRVDNCGDTIPCGGCPGCCDGNTCRTVGSREACGTGGSACQSCSGVCVGNACLNCSATNRCPAGMCCDNGACVASCPDCQVCNSAGVCEADVLQNRTACQVALGGTGVCCSGSCCAGCCDANEVCGACLAFVTSTPYTGDLGGLAGADAKCQARAEAGNLPGTYKAWLSDSTHSPSTRFRCRAVSCSAQGYTRVGGFPIASNWEDLTDGTLAGAIQVNELGGLANPSFPLVWTHARANGTPGGFEDANCQNWTSADGAFRGAVGDNTEADSTWTDIESGNFVCNSPFPSLYCFQQS